jgi:predicted small metal-binding protein
VASPNFCQSSRKVLPKDFEYITARKEQTMQKVINCPCGFTVTAETEDQLVAKAQQHAKEVHQMDLTREDALSMAKPSQGDPLPQKEQTNEK